MQGSLIWADVITSEGPSKGPISGIAGVTGAPVKQAVASTIDGSGEAVASAGPCSAHAGNAVSNNTNASQRSFILGLLFS
jgi:hypothetical protein